MIHKWRIHLSFLLQPAVLLLFFLVLDTGMLSAQKSSPVMIQNAEVEQWPEYRNGNMYQKDLLLFYDMLVSTHPAFAPDVPHPFDMAAVRQEGYQWAGRCHSKEDLWNYLQKTVSMLHDGHTALTVDYNSSRIYPFMFYEVDNHFYLYTVTRQYAASLGKQIISINGVPVQEVIRHFRPLFSCDNEIDFKQKIRNQISFEILWSQHPFKRADGRLLLAFQDSTSICLDAKTANERDLVALQTQRDPLNIRQNRNTPFQYTILNEYKIAYLQFNTCEDQSSLRLSLSNNNRGLTPEQIEQRLSQFPRFDTFLSNMFGEMAAKGVKTFVVDVRNNQGGNSLLCDVLLSWLKPVDAQKREASRIRFSRLWEMNYPQTAAKYKEAFAQNGITYQLGEIYDSQMFSNLLSETEHSNGSELDYNELFIKNADPEKIFNGNVIFIQNTGTYSSAGLLITNAVDNHIGIVIGSEGAFRPCHYGDLLTWQLPHTGISGTISHKFFTRPDTARCGDESIRPITNIPYRWEDILQGNDVYWRWVLDWFGEYKE